MGPLLKIAGESDLGDLLPLVARYHAFEGIGSTRDARERAVRELVCDRTAGAVWLILVDGVVAGYLAVCYCFSIEFGGRACVIDEFFLEEGHRGRGYGRRALREAGEYLAREGVRAMSLEIGESNDAGLGFYLAAGFEPRDGYRTLACRIGG